MTLWLILLAGGVITFAIRLSFILLLGHADLPAPLVRALRLVPPAVLSAIIFPELLYPGGNFDLSLGNERLLAGTVASLVAWRTRSILLTIAAGLLALFALQALLPPA